MSHTGEEPGGQRKSNGLMGTYFLGGMTSGECSALVERHLIVSPDPLDSLEEGHLRD